MAGGRSSTAAAERLARVEEKQDAILKAIEAQGSTLEKLDTYINEIGIGLALAARDISTLSGLVNGHDGKLDALRDKVNVWSGINSLATLIIGAVMAWLGLNQK